MSGASLWSGNTSGVRGCHSSTGRRMAGCACGRLTATQLLSTATSRPSAAFA